MNAHPMVGEVNRLVGNLLAGGGELFLPGIGSLYVEHRAAKRLTKRTVEPPCRVVSFTSQQRGASLVELLARAAQCDEAAAQDIYERWLARTREGDVLTIGEVGALKFKNFIPTPDFDKRLNPQGHAPVRIRPARRGFDWVLWVGVGAILAALVVFGLQWFMSGGPDWFKAGDAEPAAFAEVVAVPESQLAAPAIPADTVADTLAVAVPAESGESVMEPGPPVAEVVASAATTASAASQSVGTPDAPATFVPGRHYVVLGVFSTPENAARVVSEATAKGELPRCNVYRYGNKYLVSAFESADADAAARFIREHRDSYAGMWPYTAR